MLSFLWRFFSHEFFGRDKEKEEQEEEEESGGEEKEEKGGRGKWGGREGGVRGGRGGWTFSPLEDTASFLKRLYQFSFSPAVCKSDNNAKPRPF